MSDIVIRFRDQYSVGPQIGAFGYRPVWNEQYIIGKLTRYIRRVDLKTGSVLASSSLPFTPIAAAVIPQIPGSVAVTPYSPSGPVFWLAVTGDDGHIRVYNRETLALVATLGQVAGDHGILYAARAGIVFDGPNEGELVYYNQHTDSAISRVLIPGGGIAAALWAPPSTTPEIHYIFDGVGHIYMFTFDGTRWGWASTVAGAGLTDVFRAWTDSSQSWPYYAAPRQMQIAASSPDGGGSVATYSLVDPLNPVYVSTSRGQTAYGINDIAGGAAASRTATTGYNGQFPLIHEWKPMQSIIPVDPGPDAVPLGVTIHSDQGEWWLLGSSTYTPFFQYRTLTYTDPTAPVGDVKGFTVTPVSNSSSAEVGVSGTYRFRIRGQSEKVLAVTGGTVIPNTGGMCYLDPTSFAFTYDRLLMVIMRADGTNTIYLFNGTPSMTPVFTAIDYVVDIALAAGDTVYLEYNTVDGRSLLAFQNQYLYLPADDDAGHPYNAFPPDPSLLGAAIQVDLLSIR